MSGMRESLLLELAEYEARLTGIESRFKKTRDAIWIREGDAEHLLQYIRELIDLLDSALGKPNRYSNHISSYYTHGIHNMSESPSLQSVRDIIATMKAIQTYIRRPTTVLMQNSGGVHAEIVAESRLNELRTLPSEQFDFAKLIRLCEELNAVYISGCYYSAAMLIRSILDHVPPIFGKSSFTEVANNYGTKSFKDTMHGLETGAKNIADGYLHSHIRKRESLPTAQQVHFNSAA
jgi:hypothetical protein